MCFLLPCLCFPPLLFLCHSFPCMPSHIRSVTSIRIHQSLFFSSSLCLTQTHIHPHTHTQLQSLCVSPDKLFYNNYCNESVFWRGQNHMYFLPVITLPNMWDDNVWRITANMSCRLMSKAATLKLNVTDVKDTTGLCIDPRLSINQAPPLTPSHNATGCLL